MMVLEIDDRKLEAKISDFLKVQQKDLKEFTKEAVERFLDRFSSEELKYQKLDPKKHIKKIQYEVENDDEVPYLQVNDSAEYIKNLRRKKV